MNDIITGKALAILIPIAAVILAIIASNYAIVQVASALAANKIALVPQIMVSGGNTASGGHCGTLVDVLLANLITGQMKKPDAPATP